MGKRELLLILIFAVIGGVVYSVTAPPSNPGEQGFSIARIFDNVRREVRGNRSSAETTTTGSQPASSDITELRVNVLRGPITIVGEDRDTVESELHVRSTGYDEAEAAQLAGETLLKFEQTGSLLTARVDYPQPGRQTATLKLRVPARLRIRIEGTTSKLDVSGVAALEAPQAQGETIVREIGGRVAVSHRGGSLTIADAGSLRLSTRGSTVTLEGIRGEAEITTQAGELTASGMTGAVELNGTASRIEYQAAEDAGGMVRITLANGALIMKGLATESRIDVRNAALDVQLARAAEVAVFSEGGESVRITPPPAGFRLNAHAREGRIISDPEDLFATWGVAVEQTTDSPEQRLTGDIKGGGPMMTVRSRGDIIFSVK